MNPSPERELVLIVLEAEGDGPDIAIRLRRALKGLLRQHGLRCRWIQDAPNWTFGDEIEQTESREINDEVMT